MNGTILVFWLFATVAAGGVFMLALLIRGKGAPAFMRTGHGMAGLVCLVLLFGVNLLGEGQTTVSAWWALIVFTMGLIGGLIFFRILFPRSAPLWLVLGHGSLGAIGVYLLYLAAF